MVAIRPLAAMLALAAVVGLAFGAAGFSGVDAERPVDVRAAANQEACVPVVACNASASNGTTVRVSNQYLQPVTVTAILGDEGGDQLASDATIAPGGREQFDAIETNRSVTVVAESAGLSAEIDRDVRTANSSC
ncbi:MAG: hypothetical protein ABEJ79_09045 [Halolamina sp.]